MKAFEQVDDWLQQPSVKIILPTQRHWAILRRLLKPLGSAGNLMSAAHLAAIAIEHGASLYSTDNDFSRFENLRWVDPLTSN